MNCDTSSALLFTAFCLCGIALGSVLILHWNESPPPPLKHASLSYNDVQVITCGTKQLEMPYDFTKNICINKKWKGFGWKMKQFLQYAKTQPNNTVLVLVDAKDVFVNHKEFRKYVTSRFDQFNADVVISSDEICRPEVCDRSTRERQLLKKLSLSRSAFANSAIAGKAWALEEVLTSLLQPDWSDKKDDQIAASDAILNPIYSFKAKLVLDTDQFFFGSFAHVYPKDLTWGTRLVNYLPFRNYHKNKYICTNGQGKLLRNCLRVPIVAQDDISVTLADNVMYVVDPRSCSVKRFESTLGFNPIVWHGNWLGRQVYRALKKKRLKCLRKLWIF